jgi:DNA repair protein RadC
LGMTKRYSIKELPTSDRPRERMLEGGSEYLSNPELIAILIGGGYQDVSALELANQILAKLEGLRGLKDLTIRDLMQFKGIGLAKATSLRAAIELGMRLARIPETKRPEINNPLLAAQLIMPKYGDRDQEHVGILALDVKNKLLLEKVITIGILDGSLIHPREVFRPALNANAASILLFHNHPSGDVTPSSKDIDVTKRLVNAGKMLGIEVADHLIVSPNNFTSLKQLGHI